MRKLIISFLCVLLAFASVSCASKKTEEENAPADTAEKVSEAITEDKQSEELSIDSFDYSEPFDERGCWKGINALEYVTLCDYENIDIPTDEELKAEDTNKYSYIVDYLSKRCNVSSYPDLMFDYQAKALCVSIENIASSSNISYHEMLNNIGYKDSDELIEASREEINEQIKKDLIIQAIAEEQSITMNEDLLAEYFKNSYDIEDYSSYVERYGIGYIMYSALSEIVLKTVAGEAVFE